LHRGSCIHLIATT